MAEYDNAMINARLTRKEVDVLIHHHKVDEARWSNEEPAARAHARSAQIYWELVAELDDVGHNDPDEYYEVE